jgi:hypothetical protein
MFSIFRFLEDASKDLRQSAAKKLEQGLASPGDETYRSRPGIPLLRNRTKGPILSPDRPTKSQRKLHLAQFDGATI